MSYDVHTNGGGETPPCAGFAPNALPEAQNSVAVHGLCTGVSTRIALCRTISGGVKQFNFCNLICSLC